MKKIFIIIGFITSGILFAQQSPTDINEEIDQLKSPQSPAAVLLGIAESEITRPSDVSDFITSIRQASSGFSSIPLNYAVEFSPYWLWKKKTTDAKSFLGNNVGDNIKQSITLSVANNNNDIQSISNGAVSNSALALGLRFSFLRGNISDETNEKIDIARKYMDRKNSLADKSNSTQIIVDLNKTMLEKIDVVEQNEALSESVRKIKIDSIINFYAAYKSQLTDQAYDQDDINDSLKTTLQGLEFTRTGFKLDFNSAVSWQFPEQLFRKRQLGQAGAWLSGGFELKNHISFLALVRYQYFGEDQLIGRVKNHALDAGGRLLYTQNKFTLSAEIVYRNNKGIEDQKYKYLINLDYKIGDNQKLNLSFGKDFNGTFTKDGNVISALNFLMGFGNKRKLNDASTTKS